jgi:chromosome segregation ATPase
LEDEKDDIIKDKVRQIKENERCYKVIDDLETRISALKKDLTDTKESLNRTKLERDVTLQDKSVIADALSRAEIQKAELELECNKMKAEESKLRDILLKMQSLNEGLTQDKTELNRIMAHLEQDKQNLLADKQDLECVKNSLKSELVKVEQEKQDLENERESLSHNLHLADIGKDQLEQEIVCINKEKADILEQLQHINRQRNA